MSRKVIFLDRDGTLNVDDGFVHRIDDFRWLPGALDAVKRLRDCGPAIAVVTNQSGIARGMYAAEDVEQLHEHMRRELIAHGTRVDAIAFCPHGPDDGCSCRKPRTGMTQQIEEQLGETIDYPASWTIGDKPSDIEFGQQLGTRTALLRSRYWKPSTLAVQPDHLADTLLEAVQRVIQEFGD